MPSQHAEFGFSKIERIINCPGSHLLAAKVPETPSSTFADRGTLLHNAMEKIMREDLASADVLGMTYRGHVIDDELLTEKIIPAVVAVGKLFDRFKVDTFSCEAKVTLTADTWGTGDLFAYGHDEEAPVTLVIDYKFGDGVMVDATDNWQLKGYAAAGYFTKATEDMYHPEGKVILAIIQPSSHRTDDYHLWEVPGRADQVLNDIADSIDTAVALAKQPDQALCAGDHCKWCPAAPTCPQKNGDARRALLMDPEDLESLSEAMTLVTQLKAWAKSVESAAFTQLEAGAQVAGWKLVLKHARRSWVDEEEAIDKLGRKLGGKGKITTTKILSPAQIEILAKALEKKVDISELTQSVASGTTMVEEADKRPEVMSGAAMRDALASIQ